MVTSQSNYYGSVTKGYALGEIEPRVPYVTDVVGAKNDEAFTAGQVLIYDTANNYYKIGSAGAAITNVVVALEDKATTADRVNVLITGMVCVKTASVLEENDYCKIAATGQVTKWVSGTDDLNIQAPIIFKKQADKISEGFGVKPTDATTSDPGNKVLVWVNSPLGRGINAAA
ncbi:MAG: hypothetical protein R2685_10835 [Candidatus Nitrosocosmicus sp.]|nr:hypothetical protein [Candidatus Nitrosocosmicus sp.]